MNLHIINEWFKEHDKWVNEVQRANRLGLAWSQYDKLLKVTYHSLEELDLKAEEMRALHNNEKERIKQRMIEWRKSKGLEVQYDKSNNPNTQIYITF